MASAWWRLEKSSLGALRPLFSAGPEPAVQIRTIYTALGQSLSMRRALAAKTEALGAMLGHGPALSLDHAQALGEMADGDPQVQEMLAALVRARAQAEEFRTLMVTRMQELEALQAERETDRAKTAELLAAQAQELEALRIERQAAARAALAERARLEAAAERARLEAAAAVTAAEAARAERDALLYSTTWRATRPLRRVGEAMSMPARRATRRVLRAAYWLATLQFGRRMTEWRAARAGLPAPMPATAEPPSQSPRCDWSARRRFRRLTTTAGCASTIR